jgi:hypothetical protein
MQNGNIMLSGTREELLKNGESLEQIFFGVTEEEEIV